MFSGIKEDIRSVFDRDPAARRRSVSSLAS